MGMLEKAVAGVGQGMVAVGMDALKNKSALAREERLMELRGGQEEALYQRNRTDQMKDAGAAGEAALAKEQRGYKQAKELKAMDVAAQKTTGKRPEATFIRPHDKKEFSQKELMDQYKVENKIPDIDVNQLMLMDDTTQARLLEKLTSAPSFIEWAKNTQGIDITGGFKPDSGFDPAEGSAAKPSDSNDYVAGLLKRAGERNKPPIAQSAQMPEQQQPQQGVATTYNPLEGLRTREAIDAEKLSKSPGALKSVIDRDIAKYQTEKEKSKVDMGKSFGLDAEMGDKERGKSYTEQAAAETRVNRDIKDRTVPKLEDLKIAYQFAKGKKDEAGMKRISDLYDMYYQE